MRTLLVRLSAATFAVMALVWPGYGVIDLSATWDPLWNPVLSGGWGLFFSAGVAFPFALVFAAPDRCAPAVWALVLACAALSVAAIASEEPQAAPLIAWLMLGIMCITAPRPLHGWWAADLDFRVRQLVVVGALSSPWVAYAWHMSANNRQGRVDTDFTDHVDHYCVQAALGLTLTLLTLIAASWPAARRQVTTIAATCAVYLGVLSLRWPDFPGSLPNWWAWAAMTWGAGAMVWGWRGAHATRAAAPPSATQPL